VDRAPEFPEVDDNMLGIEPMQVRSLVSRSIAVTVSLRLTALQDVSVDLKGNQSLCQACTLEWVCRPREDLMSSWHRLDILPVGKNSRRKPSDIGPLIVQRRT